MWQSERRRHPQETQVITLTVDNLTKQLLRPEFKRDRFFKEKVAALNRELANINAERAKNDVIREKSVSLAKMVLAKPDPKNRWDAFTEQEKGVIQTALQKLLAENK